MVRYRIPKKEKEGRRAQSVSSLSETVWFQLLVIVTLKCGALCSKERTKARPRIDNSSTSRVLHQKDLVSMHDTSSSRALLGLVHRESHRGWRIRSTTDTALTFSLFVVTTSATQMHHT